MDILAHGLWTAAAGTALRQRRPCVTRRTVIAAVLLSMLPDVVPFLPILAASFAEPEPLRFLAEWIFAEPGTEPRSTASVIGHHLHCTMHSVLVLGALTLALLVKRREWLLPLAGWWLHIAIDVPTHSSEYYPVTLFYPLSDWAFDGVAWKSPALLIANYAVLALVFAYLHFRPRRPMKAA